MAIEFAMDDFSNVDPDINYSQSYMDDHSATSDYDNIKFKDIFESDNSQSNSVSITGSDDEYARGSNLPDNNSPEISFTDLVLKELDRLNSTPRRPRIVNRTGRTRSQFVSASKLINASSLKQSSISRQSTVDMLLDENDLFNDAQNHVETTNPSSYQDFNHVPNTTSSQKTRVSSKKSSPKRLSRTKPFKDPHTSHTTANKSCESCKTHNSKITTLEADLAVEKQHIEEMCKTISELKNQLDASLETISNMTKQQNHLLSDKDLHIQQLTDRNSELLKRIELNVNDINYFKNCLLENHNKLETLQSKLNSVTNENAELLSSIDRYKAEIDKLTNSNNNYKKELAKQNFKRLNSLSSSLDPAPGATTRLLSLPSTNDTPVETARFTDQKSQFLYNMPTIENNIFPSTLSSNMCSAYTTTDGGDLDATFNQDSVKVKKNEDAVDKNQSKYVIAKDLTKLLPKSPVAKDKNATRKSPDIPLNPTTKWILDRVSRPSNMESLFKLQDKIRDMSLKM